MRIKTTGEIFDGIHEPLISTALFDRVREVASGRLQTRAIQHRHMFRRLFSCVHCGKTLIGELQKGHVYYRCHSKSCPTKTIREEAIDETIGRELFRLAIPQDHQEKLFRTLDLCLRNSTGIEEHRLAVLSAERERISVRIDRLMETYLDGSIDKATFTDQHGRLLKKRKTVEEGLNGADGRIERDLEETRRYLELAFGASLTYGVASNAKKREFTELYTSNRTVNRRNVTVELREPFSTLVCAEGFSECEQTREVPRTRIDGISDSVIRSTPKWCAHIIDAFLRFAKG